MRAVIVIFDTLNRCYLPNYGNTWVYAPNFKRLANQCATFENFYAGSMPCMPARRELHTGRYNFPFRGWGPLEPFDFSVFEELKTNGVYTHLITDHDHYFEDGGATYHNRYTTWEAFRGQEGDRWVPQDLAIPNLYLHPLNKKGISVKQHFANRTRMQTEDMMSTVRTINAGVDYLKAHKDTDQFCLQIECFDPHEPFYAPQKYRNIYRCLDEDGIFNWPAYQRINVKENCDEIVKVQKEYAALLSMCDMQLGKILDVIDEQDMWKDTLLIVTTDHGFLLGEHGFIGKNIFPPYEELVHIPFFIHDPRHSWDGKRYNALAQTIDIAPTLLEFFGIVPPASMDGMPISSILLGNKENQRVLLFGVFGGQIGLYDGRYTYIRGCAKPDNNPLFSYTLMPTNMRGFFPQESLEQMQIAPGMRFTNGIPCLKIPTEICINPFYCGSLLFDIANDPHQENNIIRLPIEAEMVEKLKSVLRRIDAPSDVFERLGLEG